MLLPEDVAKGQKPMAKPDAFNVLRTIEGGDLIVVADFAATGRPAASFHDLVPLLKAPHHIWETAPVRWGQEAGLTGVDQAERWLDGIRSSGLRVRALLGFCGGGVYAAIMADAIARWQDRPHLVLFDPGFAKRQMLVEHLESFFRRLSAAFTPEQSAQAHAALRAADEGGAEPLGLADRLGVLCQQILLPAIIRAGYSPAASGETANLVNGYLHWLAGAISLDPSAGWGFATALNSASPNAGLEDTPPAERASLFAKSIDFDVAHRDLLRTPAVAQTADELLS
jgi:hypothetical protein